MKVFEEYNVLSFTKNAKAKLFLIIVSWFESDAMIVYS